MFKVMKKKSIMSFFWRHRGQKKWLVMKLTALFIFVFSFTLVANTSAQQERVNLNLKNVSIRTLFGEIQKQTALSFVYNMELTQHLGQVSVKAKQEAVESVLNRVLANTGLSYKFEGDIIVICESIPVQPVQSEQKKEVVIEGKVVDKDSMAIIGATVLVKGTTLGTATDLDGNFKLTVPSAENIELEFSFVGMKKQVIKVKALSDPSPLKVVMEDETVGVDEVVVVGYGVTSTRDLTGQVASLNEEQLSKKSATNVETMLQNAAAGVVVSLASSNPSEKIRVRVRGEASLTGDNEPLYVVDGMPVTSDVMSAISPSDIQSMDVLKDASAAAIYGSRGANGVVIVTTKRGKSGKPDLNVNYAFSVDSRINNFSTLDGDEFREYVRYVAEQTLKVDPSNKMANSILKEGSTDLKSGNTDWYKELKRPSHRHDLNLSVRGGGEHSNYYISLGVLDYQGMVEHDDFTRYTGRINLDYDITDFLKFGTSTTLGYTDVSSPGISLYTAIGFRPDYPIYNEDGSYYKEGNSYNPVAQNDAKSYNDNYSILSTSFLELNIWKGLKLKTTLSLNQNMSYSESYTPTYLTSDNKGYGTESTSRSFTTVFDNTLSWVGRINDIHALDAVVGISFERTKRRGFGVDAKNYPMDKVLTGITNASEIVRKSGSGTVYGLQSSFARINYRLLDKYLLTFTARYDGSSSFGSNNRYGFFPSGAIAWRVSDESFMRNVKFLDDLKIKFSVGKTGVQNFDLGSYANKDLYSTGSYLDNPSIVHSQLGNKDIKWETTVQYDLGIDFSILRSLLSGSIAYYRKNTDDLIWTYTPPSSLAVEPIPTNVGSVRNQGIEISLRANLLRGKKDWSWELGLNASHNRNKVLELVEQGETDNGMGITIQGSGNQVLAEGHAMGAFFGYQYEGIIQDQTTINELNAQAVAAGKNTYNGSGLRPGHLLLRDVDGSGYIDNKDRMIIGSPEADLIGGLTSTLAYKRLSLYMHFGFQIGGKKLFNKTLQNLPNQLTGLVDYNLDNRWSEDNRDAKLPAMYIGDGVAPNTSLSLFNASNLRLQELRLSYDIPKLWGGKYLNSGEIYFTANNLFVITKYPGQDPSTIGSATSNYGSNYENWNYPSSRTFSFGVKLNF